MKILVLGAGGIGGYFGARLAAAGQDVTFLVRPARAERLAEHGLVVRSPLGDCILPKIHFVTKAEQSADLILLACKAYDLASAMEAITPAVGPGSLILPLLNGLRHMDDLDAHFGQDRVLGGSCHIGVTLNEAGEILHLNSLQRFILGARTPHQQAEAAHAALLPGGFGPVLSPDITQTMWDKFAFLTAYAGITCLMRASIGAIAATRNGAAIALALFDECAAVAKASGHPLGQDFADSSRAMMTDVKSSGTASMLRDLQHGARTEHEHILGDMLNRAEKLAVATPVLKIAHAHLQAYCILTQAP